MSAQAAVTAPFTNWRRGRDYELVSIADNFELLFVTGSHHVFRINRDLAGRLRRGVGFLRPEELEEWQSLSRTGAVSNVNGPRLDAQSPLDGANLAINVNLTAACNLNCTYCFADGGDYGRFQGKMQATTVDSIIEFISRHVTPSHVVRFEFFGGEPLLNFERIREICDRSDELSRDHGVRFIYRISTNLTVLPPGAARLFAKRNFIVSVSVDGGPESHNRNRPGKDGRGSWDRIMAHCRAVREGADDVTMVARMTVTGGTPTLSDNVATLYEFNIFDYFQVYPAFSLKSSSFISIESLRSGVTTAPSKALSDDVIRQFAEFLEIYPSLFSTRNRFRGVLEYERLAQMILDGKLALGFCSAGRNYFTFSPDDSIAPCHRLAGDASFQVGSGDLDIQANLEPWRRHVDTNPTCSQCWIRYLCGGGCKQENYLSTGSIHTPNRDLCDYQMMLVRGVLRGIAAQSPDYRRSDRAALDNLFVSCGRPVVPSGRAEVPPARHFQPV